MTCDEHDPTPYTLVRELGEAVAAAFAYPPEDQLQRVCLIVPGEIADDICECGMLAVTVPQIYGSRNPRVPAADDADTAPCGMPYLVVDVLIRIMRCVPGPDQAGNPPSCEDLDQAARQQHRDMRKVRRAAGCTLHMLYEADRIVGFQLGETISVGPSGGCVGSQTAIKLWIPDCLCPEQGL